MPRVIAVDGLKEENIHCGFKAKVVSGSIKLSKISLIQ
jgi:hypothetical protein